MADLIKATYTQKNEDGTYTPYAFKTTANWTFLTDNGTDFSENTVEWKFISVDTELSGIKTEIGFDSEENEKINGSTKVIKHVSVNGKEQAFSDGVVTIPSIATSEQVSALGEKVLAVSGKLSDIEDGIGEVEKTAGKAIPKTQIYAKQGEDNTEKMIAYAVEKEDGTGEIPLTLLPDTILGQLYYKGTIAGKSGSGKFYTDKSNPSGTVVSISGVEKGNYYICSQAVNGDDLKTILGTASMAELSSSEGLNVGDWLICLSKGTQFAKIDSTDAVSTIDGNIGNVVLREIRDASNSAGIDLAEGEDPIILPKVAVGEGSRLSISDSLADGDGLANNGRKFIIGTDTDESGASYTIPLSSDIEAWKAKPSIDTKLKSFSGSVKNNATAGYDDSYTLSVTDTSGKSVSTDIPALSGTQSVGLVSKSMPQEYGKGKGFYKNVSVAYPGNSLNYFHINYLSYQGEDSTPFLSSEKGRFKIPSRDDAVTTMNSQKTGSFITETQADGLYSKKQTKQTYDKDYLSAMTTINGVAYTSGRKIVLASSLKDSILDELIPNGFAIIAEEETKWTVTIQPGNGNADFSYTVVDGSLISAPDTPVSDGHEFNFWADSNAPDTPYDFSQPIKGDVTIIGVWKAESESWDKTYDTSKWISLHNIVSKDGVYKFYPYKVTNVEGRETYSIVSLRKPYSASDDGNDMYARNQMYLFPGMRNLKVITDESTGINTVKSNMGFMSGTYDIENPLVEYTRICGIGKDGKVSEGDECAGLTIEIKGGKATVTVSSYMPFRAYPAVVSDAIFDGLGKKIGLANNEDMLHYYSMFTNDLGIISSPKSNYPAVSAPATFFNTYKLLSEFSGIFGLMYEHYVSKIGGNLELLEATTDSAVTEVPNNSWKVIETYEFEPEETTFEPITTEKAFTVSNTSVFKDWYVLGTKVMYTNS